MIGYRVFSPKRAWSVTTTMFMRYASKQRSRRKVEKQFPHKHAVMQPVAVRKESLGQRCLIWQRAACRLAATVSFRSLANIGSSLRRETDHANCKMNKNPECSVNEGANRRKGESRAPSPFPLGGCSALPRTGGIPQPLEARPYGQTMPAHLRVRHLDLATCRQQALKVSVPKTEWSPAIEAILSFPKRLSSYPERKSTRLNLASDGFIQRVSTPCLFHAKLEKFFVRPLFEFLPTSKELFVCRRKPMITILSRSELESTYVVGNLREPVLRSHCGSVYDRALKENKVYCFMQGICNGALSAVVIDFDFVKWLKTAEIVKEELYEPFSHSARHVVFRSKLFHSEFKQLIANRQMSHEYSKCIQQPSSGFERKSLILAMPGHEGRCMERDVRHISSYQTLLIKADRFSDARILVVEYQSKQVIGLSQVIAAGFIDKNTQLCHINHSKKKAGENVPGTWRPLRR